MPLWGRNVCEMPSFVNIRIYAVFCCVFCCVVCMNIYESVCANDRYYLSVCLSVCVAPNKKSGSIGQVWLLICVSPKRSEEIEVSGSLNPLFRDYFRLRNVENKAKIFTWNLTELKEQSDLHFDGKISKSNIQRKERYNNSAYSHLKNCCLDYVVIDFVHLPTEYFNRIVPGALEVIMWLTKRKIITAETIIEFKNLIVGHMSSEYIGKLKEFEKMFSGIPLKISESVWGKETQKYYDHVLRKNVKLPDISEDALNISDNFKDCVQDQEILQFQLLGIMSLLKL